MLKCNKLLEFVYFVPHHGSWYTFHQQTGIKCQTDPQWHKWNGSNLALSRTTLPACSQIHNNSHTESLLKRKLHLNLMKLVYSRAKAMIKHNNTWTQVHWIRREPITETWVALALCKNLVRVHELDFGSSVTHQEGMCILAPSSILRSQNQCRTSRQWLQYTWLSN